jgi:tetratricopeptide (TPR) repeat protein
LICNRFAAVPLMALLLLFPRTTLAGGLKDGEINHDICADRSGSAFLKAVNTFQTSNTSGLLIVCKYSDNSSRVRVVPKVCEVSNSSNTIGDDFTHGVGLYASTCDQTESELGQCTISCGRGAHDEIAACLQDSVSYEAFLASGSDDRRQIIELNSHLKCPALQSTLDDALTGMRTKALVSELGRIGCNAGIVEASSDTGREFDWMLPFANYRAATKQSLGGLDETVITEETISELAGRADGTCSAPPSAEIRIIATTSQKLAGFRTYMTPPKEIPDLLSVRGVELALIGDLSGAKSDLDRLGDDVVSPSALNNLCFGLAILDRLDEAARSCDTALQLKPQLADALDSRGLVFLKRNEYRKAIADFDAALNLNPRMASSLFGRGIAKKMIGDKAGGVADQAYAKDLDRDVADDYGHLRLKEPLLQ